MKLLRVIGLMLTLLVLYAPNSLGDPIPFTHQGVGSGSINGHAFTSTAFTITATGGTATRQAFVGGFFINHLTASISIAGVGDFTFITPTRTFVNNNSPVVGFSRAGLFGADLFNGPFSAAFQNWDMLTSIGPVAGNGNLQQWTLTPVLTSGGQLIFDSDNSTPATFTATVGVAAVPEPASLTLLGLGFGGGQPRQTPAFSPRFM